MLTGQRASLKGLPQEKVDNLSIERNDCDCKTLNKNSEPTVTEREGEREERERSPPLEKTLLPNPYFER